MRHRDHDRSLARSPQQRRLRHDAPDSCADGLATGSRGRNMPKQTRYYLNALFLLVLLGAATAADAQVDQQRAQEYFKEARALCERDGGRLWGVSLCAPMVIADLQTQTIATSQPAPEGPRPRGLGI